LDQTSPAKNLEPYPSTNPFHALNDDDDDDDDDKPEVGATETVSKSCTEYQSSIPPNYDIKEIQKTATVDFGKY
jgi:hypothetical protein